MLFKTAIQFIYTVPIFLMTTPLPVVAQPILQNILGHQDQIVQYEKMEWQVQLAAAFTNPFDYTQVSLQGIFISPDGDTVQVDGFFMQDYTLTSVASGAIVPKDQGGFRLRFAPYKPGLWHYFLRLTDQSGQAVSPVQSFTCKGSMHSGFIRRLNDRYLGFEDGSMFIPVGENMGWHQSNPYTDYRLWLGDLRGHGGNFYRLWQCHWGLGLEWRPGQGYEGLRRYHQANSYYLDQLFEYSDDQGLYLMWALQHHGQVSTQVNPNWSESPYNQANGGSCTNTWDFFTQSAARDHTINRYRYILARWGHHRCIAAWELFNEVDWTDDFVNRRKEVAEWHTSMSHFLRSADPYGHLITTSFAQDHYDPQVWQDAQIDFTQTHYYPQVSNPEKVLAAGVKKYALDFGKPTLNGEFSITTSGHDLSTIDRQGIHVHNGMWASLFSGSCGVGLSWWWDSYIAPNNLYYHFEGISKLAPQLIEADFQPVSTTVQGAPADLTLNPSVGWAGKADTLFNISSNSANDTKARLGQYLYGSVWNTQYRQPPAFEVDLEQASQLHVTTGAQTGQAARLAFWLDGVKMSDQAAQINQTYTLAIPAGKHRIVVDNTGTDWITIKAYTFSGLGSQVDAYVLANTQANRAAGWILNTSYNHDYLRTQGMPLAVTNAQLSIEGVKKGSYRLDWFNSLTGVLISSSHVDADQAGLTIIIPDLRWDLVFALQETTVATPKLDKRQLSFEVYPNPAREGFFYLRWDMPLGPRVQVSISDQLGREVSHQVYVSSAQVIKAPSVPGLYWVTISYDGAVLTKALIVGIP